MKQKRKGPLRRLAEKLRKVPHLFAKCIIVHCILVVTVAAYWSLFAQYRGAEMTGLFAAIAAPFVTELAMLLLKTLFKKENKHNDEPDNEEGQDENSSDEQDL